MKKILNMQCKICKSLTLFLILTESKGQLRPPREFVFGCYVEFDPPKDGDCQFHAICDQLRKHAIITTPEQLRHDIVSYIESYPYLSDRVTRLENFLTTDLNTYLEKMACPGTFGDHITLTAAAALYNIQIVVISDNKEFPPRVISNTGTWCPTERFMTLGHREEGKGEHYVSLTASNSQTLSNLLQSNGTIANVTQTADIAALTSTTAAPQTALPERALPHKQTDLGTLVGGPARPILHNYPKTNFGKQNRAFSTTQYDSYDFIEYSISLDAVFCFPCRHFTSPSAYKDIAFTEKGMRDWKKIKDKVDKHIGTQSHMDSTTLWNEYKNSLKTGSVVTKLANTHKLIVAENWKYAEKVTEALLFLAKQGLAIRGHDESKDSVNRGNFLELCSLLGRFDCNFDTRLNKSLNLTSHETQNDLLGIAAGLLMQNISDDVHKVGFFCLIADEARSFRDEQLAVCVRYAVDLNICERFVMFADCSECRDAGGITRELIKALTVAKLDDVPIIAQAYDGASVMSGKDNGVQRKVRDLYPTAVYVHCMGHKLNLVIVACCMTTRHVVTFFSNIQALYVFFSRPGNNKLFMRSRDLLGISAKAPLLTDLSDTRWACRWRNVNATKQSFIPLLACLKEQSQPESGNRCISEAAGLLHQMKQTSFMVCLVVVERVLSLVQVVHAVLQKKAITISQASSTAANTVASLERFRCDSEWKIIWNEVCLLRSLAGIQTNDIAEPQQNHSESRHSRARSSRRPTKVPRMEDFLIMSTCGQRQQHSDLPESSYDDIDSDDGKPWQMEVFYPVLDSVIGEMKRRFLDPEIVKLSKAVEAVMLLNDADGMIQELLTKYSAVLEINPALLKAEMHIVRSSISVPGLQRFNPSYPERFSPPASAAEVEELKNYPNLFKVLQLAITLPVSSATCERSFSAMRRVRNYLRTTMSEHRFSTLSSLYIERDLSSKIDVHDVVAHYAAKGQRNLHFY